MTLKAIWGKALSGAAMCLVAGSAWALSYSITDLGTLPDGSYSAAYGINASGEVVGQSGAGDGEFHAFSYVGGSLTDLGTLGGEYSLAAGVNRSGYAAGYSTLANGTYRAVLFANDARTDLGTLGGSYSTAAAINDGGQIAGSSYTSQNDEHAFLYSGNTISDLGTLGGSYSAANGINAAGTVVGYAYRADGNFHAFQYSGGTMTDLGTLGGSYSLALGINAAGAIVGQAYLSGNVNAHAFSYQNGKMTDLGALQEYSQADAINSQSVCVGKANVKSSSSTLVYHAVLFASGKVRDLNNLIPAHSGWILSEATAINDAGDIVGYGTINGSERGFILSPQ